MKNDTKPKKRDETDENEIANNKSFSSFHFRLPPRSAILLNVHIKMNWKRKKPFGINKQLLQCSSFTSHRSATDNFTFAYKHLSREISWVCFFDVTFYFQKRNVSGVGFVVAREVLFFTSMHKVAQKEMLESSREM